MRWKTFVPEKRENVGIVRSIITLYPLLLHHSIRFKTKSSPFYIFWCISSIYLFFLFFIIIAITTSQYLSQYLKKSAKENLFWKSNKKINHFLRRFRIRNRDDKRPRESKTGECEIISNNVKNIDENYFNWYCMLHIKTCYSMRCINQNAGTHGVVDDLIHNWCVITVHGLWKILINHAVLIEIRYCMRFYDFLTECLLKFKCICFYFVLKINTNFLKTDWY